MPISQRQSSTPTYPIDDAASCITAPIPMRGVTSPEAMTVHTLTLLSSTAAIGFLMVRAGLGKNALELRRRRRICPSCAA